MVESFDSSCRAVGWKLSDCTSMFTAPAMWPSAYSSGVRTSRSCTESALICCSNSGAETEVILLLLQPEACVMHIVIAIKYMARLICLSIVLSECLWLGARFV